MLEKKPKIHYASRIDHARGIVLAGWAACCSGDRAIRIRERGQHSRNRADVTCKSCLDMIAKGDAWANRKRTEPCAE